MNSLNDKFCSFCHTLFVFLFRPNVKHCWLLEWFFYLVYFCEIPFLYTCNVYFRCWIVKQNMVMMQKCRIWHFLYSSFSPLLTSFLPSNLQNLTKYFNRSSDSSNYKEVFPDQPTEHRDRFQMLEFSEVIYLWSQGF